MFDLRYHVASLAAVFLALIIGIVVGVGLSSQDVIDTDERSVLNAQIADLQRRLDAAERRGANLAQAQRNAQTFVERTYPALMADRLRTRRVAVAFVGPVDGRLRSLVEEVVREAGAGGIVRLHALDVPIDVTAVDGVLSRTRGLRRYAGDGTRDELGASLALEFVRGGRTPLWNALAPQLLGERAGSAAGPADGVVVVRSVDPQQGPTARLLRGFYAGLRGGQAPVVGVEDSGAETSAVAVYRERGLSSVDDLDTAAGRLALAVLLAGGAPGHYGVKPTATDGLLPPVEAVPTAASEPARSD